MREREVDIIGNMRPNRACLSRAYIIEYDLQQKYGIVLSVCSFRHGTFLCYMNLIYEAYRKSFSNAHPYNLPK